MGKNHEPIRLSLLLAAGLLLLSSGTALAQNKVAQAKKHFEQGEAYFKAKTYDKAVAEYQAAYDLVQKPGLLFNIGLAQEYAGNAKEAVSAYQQYLAEDAEGPKAPEARARLEALTRELLERERIATELEKRRRNAKRLAADKNYGAAVAELRAAYSVAPDPELVYEIAELLRAKGDSSGAVEEYQRYLAVEGDKPHSVEAAHHIEELRDAGKQAPPDHTPPPDGTPPPDVTPGRAVDSEPRRSLLPAAIAFGAAGVLTAVGVGFGVKSSGALSELDDVLDSGMPPLDSSDPRIDDGRRDALIANVSFALAGAAVITGGILAYRALKQPSKKSAVSIAPAVGPNRAGLGLEVSW